MRATCTRNGRDLRARRGHYMLRDLAGFADIERLFATDTTVERPPPAVADDGSANVIARSAARLPPRVLPARP
jgi:hypothetical protein